MNQTLKIILAVTGVILVGAVVFSAGVFVGRLSWGWAGFGPGGMMGWNYQNAGQGYTMMGSGGMMGGNATMGNYCSGASPSTSPLSVDQAKQAVEGYLQKLNNSDLELQEILIFDNNAYARITEKSTGIGAMELLVDPATQSVFPEYGPNMMWNLKYSPMAGFGGMMGGNGMMGGSGMMSGLQNPSTSASGQMAITPDQAVKIAQKYLDQQLPGSQADPEPDAFYGYYTIDILKGGKIAGMLSVNGFSGQVFLHTWHGKFIEKYE